MGNFKDKIQDPLAMIQGGLVGEDLLASLKTAMIQDPVFKLMFGDDGERIFTEEVPSYNDKILPLVEFFWSSERYQSRNTTQSGVVMGRVLFPTQIESRRINANFNRRVALAFQRFLGGDHDLFDVTPGLIEFGLNMDFKYDKLSQFDTMTVSSILVTIPFKFDLRLLQLQMPEVDWDGPLSADQIGKVETYSLKIEDENSQELIPEEILSVTGQTN